MNSASGKESKRVERGTNQFYLYKQGNNGHTDKAGRSKNPNKTETEPETEMKIYNFMDADTPIQGFHASDPEVEVTEKWNTPTFTWKMEKPWRG